jgi:hypothetical protein
MSALSDMIEKKVAGAGEGGERDKEILASSDSIFSSGSSLSKIEQALLKHAREYPDVFKSIPSSSLIPNSASSRPERDDL